MSPVFEEPTEPNARSRTDATFQRDRIWPQRYTPGVFPHLVCKRPAGERRWCEAADLFWDVEGEQRVE